MPNLVIPPGFAQLNFRLLVSGDPDEMIFTLGVENPDGVADPVNIAGRAYAAFEEVWSASWMHLGFTFVGVTARVGQDGGGTVDGEWVDPYDGTINSPSPPNNTALLVRKQTGVAGRRNKGRMYAPCFNLAEGDVSNAGIISSGVVSSLQTSWTAFWEALQDPLTRDMQPVLFHSEAPTTPTPVTSFSVQTKVATQRTRLRR